MKRGGKWDEDQCRHLMLLCSTTIYRWLKRRRMASLKCDLHTDGRVGSRMFKRGVAQASVLFAACYRRTLIKGQRRIRTWPHVSTALTGDVFLREVQNKMLTLGRNLSPLAVPNNQINRINHEYASDLRLSRRYVDSVCLRCSYRRLM